MRNVLDCANPTERHGYLGSPPTRVPEVPVK
jgi:hypothetical protein